MPYAGFSGPISSVNMTTAAYPGSVRFRFGKRKPQSYTYSPFYPALDYNQTQQDFYGGKFLELSAPRDKQQKPHSDMVHTPLVTYQKRGVPDPTPTLYKHSQRRNTP